MIGFFSRVTEEFKPFDEVLQREFSSLPGFALKTPKDVEGYAGGQGTIAKLWEFVASSDVVVHLVGTSLGSRPKAGLVEQFHQQVPEFTAWADKQGRRWSSCWKSSERMTISKGARSGNQLLDCP